MAKGGILIVGKSFKPYTDKSLEIPIERVRAEGIGVGSIIDGQIILAVVNDSVDVMVGENPRTRFEGCDNINDPEKCAICVRLCKQSIK
jgi:hypothetical protein